MIYITADTHVPYDCEKLSNKKFPEQENLTKSDYLIIAGDFGLIWREDGTFKWWKKWFDDKNFTTLFVDGNHENYNLLEQYPIVDKFGGKVGKISDSIYHLKRGELYEIDGKKIFTFGGAESIDKESRIREVNWWLREMPSYDEMHYGLNKLELNNFDVDIIITHSCPQSIKNQLTSNKEATMLERYFENIKEFLKEKDNTYYKWYFGHFHQDKRIENFRALFNDIVFL